MTSTTATSVQDESAVRAVLDGIYAAWADNDADAFVAGYAEDATAILPGSYLPNKEAIRATMAIVFAGPLKGSSAIHEVQNIRFLGAGTAVVISRAACSARVRPNPRPRTGRWRPGCCPGRMGTGGSGPSTTAPRMPAEPRRGKYAMPSK